VPWRAWNLVRNWAEANGYSFNYAGDLGNTSAPGPARAGDPAEPVTVLSMWDAMVWCNALSELMGRRPVYFADESLKEVHRHALPFRLQTFRGKGFPNFPFKPKLPKGEVYHSGSYLPVVMDGRANGFRLPLPEEWDLANRPAAAADKMPSFEWLADNSGGRTHPVGTKPPNALGLHDMEGNVIELTWGNTAAAIEGVPARKGSYFARPYGARHPRLDLGEFSAVGRNHCGFRVVRLPD
jgi:hypothetical protein